MNKRFLIIFQYLFFLGLGIFLVWWSVRDIDNQKMAEIRAALKNARFLLVIPVFIILIASHYARALRWRLLMEPLGYKPGKANTFFAVMIGFATWQSRIRKTHQSPGNEYFLYKRTACKDTTQFF